MGLEKTIEDYLVWMVSNGYADKTRIRYHQVLVHFKTFVHHQELPWDKAFTYDTLKRFQQQSGLSLASHAVRGFSRYLFEQHKINHAIEKPLRTLPYPVDAYVADYIRTKDVSHLQVLRTKKNLCAFYDFLEGNHIPLKSIRIEQIDSFLSDHNRGYSKEGAGTQRSILRGFLTWLYQNKWVKKNLAQQITGAPIYSLSKPPKFLRPHEIKALFSNLKDQTPLGLRVAAMAYLGFYLGLRPIEISNIEFGDLEFKKGEIRIPYRKNTSSVSLPLPECCIKTIAAYILAGRPKTDSRRLFITHRAPYRPVLAMSVSTDITRAMTRAGLQSTAYFLRHSYAQNLLESGISLYEIKEMMGHDSLQTTRRYLHIHTTLMREVLFDDDDI